MYPLVIRHVPGRYHVPCYLGCWEAAVVDVPEYPEKDAPVAIAWDTNVAGGGQSRAYRLADIGLCSPVSRAKQRNLRLAESFPSSPLVVDAMSFLIDAVSSGAHKSSTSTDPRKLDSWPSIDGELPRMADLDDIAVWRNKFRDFQNGLITVDGVLWRLAEEPVICVYRNQYGWITGLAPEIDFSSDLNRFHFPVSEWDEAREFCRSLASETKRPVLDSEYFLAPFYSPGKDTAAYDLMEVGRRVVGTVDEATQSMARKVGSSGRLMAGKRWSDYPVELFEAYAFLRRFCEADMAHVDEDTVDRAAEALKTVVEISERSAMGGIVSQPEAIKAHIHKWNSRPISFKSECNGGGPRP